MIRHPPRSTRPSPLFALTTLFRSAGKTLDGTVQRFDAPGRGLLGEGVESGLVELDDVDPRRFELARLGVQQLGEGHRHVRAAAVVRVGDGVADRSEEHTSELQSLMRISYAVFCLKKKTHILL